MTCHNPEPRSEVWWWEFAVEFSGGKCFWRVSTAKEVSKNLQIPNFAGSSPPISPGSSDKLQSAHFAFATENVRQGLAEEILRVPEIQASFLYPFSHAPLGEGGHIPGRTFLASFGGAVCRQPPPANPFSKPLIFALLSYKKVPLQHTGCCEQDIQTKPLQMPVCSKIPPIQAIGQQHAHVVERQNAAPASDTGWDSCTTQNLDNNYTPNIKFYRQTKS